MNAPAVAEARRARAKALRAQAAALTAEADALEAEASALASETARGPECMTYAATGLALATVRRAVREGRIKASKVGRHHLVSAEDVAAYIAANAVTPRPAESSVQAIEPDDPFERARAHARARKSG